MKRMKKIVVLALSLVVMGNAIAPMQVSATDADAQMYNDKGFALNDVEDKVVYESFEETEMSEKYFGKEAPTKDGYYFGGWYMTDSEKQAIKYQSQVQDLIENGEDNVVYAKFVPAYLLSVKVQNNANIDTREGAWETDPTTDNRANIRMISAIDSTRYKEVGFHLFVKHNRVWANTQSKYNKTVYSTVGAYDKDGNELGRFTAEQLFKLNPQNYEPKLIAGNFTGIPETGWKTSIFVRPYWVTFDGVEVRGNGRYIHIEDGIKGYIAVPISMQGLKNDATGVVAGTLDVTYDSTNLEYIDAVYPKSENEVVTNPDGTPVKYVECKPGADLNQVIAKETSTTGTIKCAAIRKNASSNLLTNINPNEYASVARHTVKKDTTVEQADTFEAVNNLYVMLRFKPTETARNTTQGELYKFNISNISFCDTMEAPVSVDVWDVRY